ncbi:hypothetical protein N7533_012689 [Penicillium manginii]|uniref:uncharacterized protein n=1 Tax=Penicillium manginii TaxID=203109 RepID=UPI00254673A4|nr:uncharacterized protein N7533_012689 [Penicillium manginii]KAJ5739905.1 hypothetical protein N7533_012689 [Penicillium manginii]
METPSPQVSPAFYGPEASTSTSINQPKPRANLPTPTPPNLNNTARPRPNIYNYENPTKWAEFKRMWKGDFESDKEEYRWKKKWGISLSIFILLLFILLIAVIGIYYHPPAERINRSSITNATKIHEVTMTTTITALIPISSDNGENTHVTMVRSTDASLPTPAPIQDQEAEHGNQVKHMQQKDDASIFKTRAFSSVSAPPYLDACQTNLECDWGYRCIEETCYPGCDSDSDCRDAHKCEHWKHDGPSYKYCMVARHKECRAHLEFCRNDNECCSGRCESKGKWKLCQPSTGRSQPSDSNDLRP